MGLSTFITNIYGLCLHIGIATNFTLWGIVPVFLRLTLHFCTHWVVPSFSSAKTFYVWFCLLMHPSILKFLPKSLLPQFSASSVSFKILQTEYLICQNLRFIHILPIYIWCTLTMYTYTTMYITKTTVCLPLYTTIFSVMLRKKH